MESKVCTRCGEIKPLEKFHKNKTVKSGRDCMCGACRIAKKVDRRTYESRRRSKLRTLYKMELEDFEAMREKQNYCCAVCGKHESKNRGGQLYIDHNHDTNKVRELLCNGCNRAIGFVQEDVNVLLSIIKYLEKHND